MQSASPAVETIESMVKITLEEDHAFDDATSLAVIPEDARGRALIMAKAHGVLAGRAFAAAAFQVCCPEGQFAWSAQDGDVVEPGQTVLQCEGSARGLLAAERTALNYLQQLSGVASLTAQAVKQTGGDFLVLDTRKTVPGLRDAQKAAVVAGGGVNHRRDLSDQLLLKENHFAFSGLGYRETVRAAVSAAQGKLVGAEAMDLEQALAALDEGASYVMLDNFPSETLVSQVAQLRQVHPQAVVEVSGGLTSERLAVLRAAGIDRVSLGALTHSAPALDFSFLFDGALS
jgi:nicotinate-nucleotide pyrophosphorylase (carboxylating)